VLGLPVLVATYGRFRLTDLLYSLLLLHSVILAVGGVYTYAEVPLGFWMQDWFGFARNHYDRIGHFAQGFVPALLAREVLVRTSPLRRGRWLAFLVVCVCMFVSASYELVEFGYTVAIGASAESFLGTQGDVWDAQWDMTFALVGAICSLVLLSGPHDRALARIGVNPRYDG
jgi:putative membrane protein